MKIILHICKYTVYIDIKRNIHKNIHLPQKLKTFWFSEVVDLAQEKPQTWAAVDAEAVKSLLPLLLYLHLEA